MEKEKTGKKKGRTITVPPNHSWNRPMLQEAAAFEVHDAGTTALHEASRNGHTEITELLLKHGAIVDARSIRGRTPLQCAAYKGFVEPVKVLLKHGANFNIHSEDGRTALHDAALMGHTDVAITLLEAGADPDLRTFHNSLAPVDIAATPELTKLIDTIGPKNRWKRRKMAVWLASDFNRSSDNIFRRLPADLLKRVVLFM